MKTPFCLCLAISGLVAGCGNKSGTATHAAADASSQTNSNDSGGNPITAPVDYLGAVSKAQQTAVKGVDLASVNQAIQLFQAEQGRLPKDLNELVQQKYLGRIPPAPYGTKLVYDSETGQAKIVKQ